MADKLLAEKVEEYNAAFHKFATDDKDRIEVANLGILLNGFGRSLTQNRMKRIIEALRDPTHVEFVEVLNIMAQPSPSYPFEDIEDNFRMLDTEGHGRISTVFLRHVLKKCKVPTEKINELIKQVQVDSNGKFDYLDLIDKMK